MNDAGREALVKAALDGVPQIKGRNDDGQGGYCAWGIILRAWAAECGIALRRATNGNYDWPDRNMRGIAAPIAWCEASDGEVGRIVNANNVLGWDFLTIANKFHEPDDHATVCVGDIEELSRKRRAKKETA